MIQRNRRFNSRTVASNLSVAEYDAITDAARRARQTVSVWLRSIIVDALCEEGYDFSKCSRSEGGAPTRESFSPRGGPTA